MINIIVFQSTRPHGARPAGGFRFGRKRSLFQSTRPHGARRAAHAFRIETLAVSIHAPTRGATQDTGGCSHRGDVSIHAPTRGATVRRSELRSRDMFQSTRPHGARLKMHTNFADFPGFNPRAHTGRDAAMPAERPTRYGFQSTRPHGARHTIKTIFGLIAMFQSTRPHGARPQYLQNSEVPPRVSIHAPTRGATEHILKLKVLIWSFNPRAHTGRDYNTAIITTVFAKFQSTRPHGARQCLRFGACTSVRFQSTRPHGARRSLADAQEFAPGFNPRAHTGRDIIAFVIILVYHVFQSTRPHGARPTILSNNRSLIGVSIHAPTRGATPASVRLRPHHIYSFNPRAHTGRDLFPAASRGGVFCVSIHAPTRGATTCIALLSRTLRVSIHAPTRGATASTPCAVRTQRSFNPRAHTGPSLTSS